MISQKKHIWNPGNSETFLVRLRIAFARRKILSLIPKSQRGCILDAGCGMSASFLQSIRPEFKQCIGVDFNVDCATLATKGIDTRKGDILHSLEHLESDSIDIITFLSVMEHVTQQEAILHECRRVLRKGGIVFINSPSWFGKSVLENIIIPFFDSKGNYAAQVDTHTTYFSCWKMWQTIKNSGFVSSEIRVWHSNFCCSISACITKKND